jgi:hypothetical protein
MLGERLSNVHKTFRDSDPVLEEEIDSATKELIETT